MDNKSAFSWGKFILIILVMGAIYDSKKKQDDRIDDLEAEISYITDKLQPKIEELKTEIDDLVSKVDDIEFKLMM